MAFGGGKSGGSHGSTPKTQTSHPSALSPDQYETWAEQDQGLVDELFQKELQQAILLSKVESEKQVLILGIGGREICQRFTVQKSCVKISP